LATIGWSRPKGAAPRASDNVVMASRFDLRSHADVPAFLLAALRIRRQMLTSPGVVGVSLIARPLTKTFYTLSAWESRAALDRAVADQPHATTMVRFRTKMANSVFVFWTASGSVPQWSDAHRRLAQAPASRRNASDR
jgi:hypothetical protein